MVGLAVYNLKMGRLLRPGKMTGPMDGREMRWRDVPYCAFCMWPMVIGAKLRGERVPLCVVLVGEKLSPRAITRTQACSQSPSA